jgi:hypothetical protein
MYNTVHQQTLTPNSPHSNSKTETKEAIFGTDEIPAVAID